MSGSLVGGFLATEVLDVADADEFDFGSFLIAVGVSIVLLTLYERIGVRHEPEPASAPRD